MAAAYMRQTDALVVLSHRRGVGVSLPSTVLPGEWPPRRERAAGCWTRARQWKKGGHRACQGQETCQVGWLGRSLEKGRAFLVSKWEPRPTGLARGTDLSKVCL